MCFRVIPMDLQKYGRVLRLFSKPEKRRMHGLKYALLGMSWIGRTVRIRVPMGARHQQGFGVQNSIQVEGYLRSIFICNRMRRVDDNIAGIQNPKKIQSPASFDRLPLL